MKTLRRLPKHPCELRCTSPREVNGKDAFFTGSVEFDQDSLKAAKDGEVKIPTFKMRAYTGKPMRVRGFYDPVIVNLKGAKFAKRVTPIIMDHDVSARIGHSNSQEVDVEGNEIVVQGQASSSSDYASSFVADAKAGIPFESSIGATILDSTYVPEGKSVTVNGKEWQGPLLVANKVKIREVSAVLLGADGDTETRVAASKRKPMNEFEKFVEGLGFNASELTDDQRTKLQATFDKLSTDPPKPAGKGKKKGKVAAAAVVTAEDDDDEEVTVEATYEQALDKHRENLEAEETRIDSIRSLADEYGEKVNNEHEFTIRAGKAEGKKFKGLKNFKAAAIRYGMDVNQFELACLRASRSEGTNVAGQINHNGNLESEVCEAAVARELAGSFGMPSGRERWVAGCGGNPRKFGDIPNNMQGREYGLEAYYKPEVLEKSHERKYKGIASINALLDLQMRAIGKPWHGLTRNNDDFYAHAVHSCNVVKAAAIEAYTFVRASGFSTLNVPNILENLMHKFALAAFDGQDQTWRAIAGRKNLSDFRPHNMYRLNWQGHFRQVDQQGQLKHVSVQDSKYTVQAQTFGAMITVDRKTIRNDDLGQIVSKATTIGMLGAMRIEQSVYVLLLSNPGAFFSATLGNLITGSTSALNQTGASTPATPAGLDQARRSFRNLVINGYPIGVSPSVLLVGTSQETIAYQLWAQETFAVAGVSGSVNFLLNKNEFQGLYRPVITPYLNNTALTDDEGNSISGQSNTQWMLFTNPALPQGSAIVIGFLDGRDQPYFDQADTQFNIPGGIQFRAYLDWGVAMNVWQLALKSAGA